MASDKESAEVKEMIQSLYKFANVFPAWDGDMNERVAEVFGVMLGETQKCSNAFGWVPKPPGGRASITWLAMQPGRGCSIITDPGCHLLAHERWFTSGADSSKWRQWE